MISYINSKNELIKTDAFINDEITLSVTTTGVKNGVRYIVKLIAKEKIRLKSFSYVISHLYNEEDFICPNGYQSWTDTLTTSRTDKQKSLSKIPQVLMDKYGFEYFGDWHFKKYESTKGRFHGFTYTFIKSKEGDTLFASLNDFNYFTIFNFSKSDIVEVEADVDNDLVEGEVVLLDFIVVKGKLSESFNLWKKMLNLSAHNPKINGYTSWYNYYQDINEKIILRDLKALDDTYELFQIDDGFETYVGDFMDVDKKKFPNGLEPIVDLIHSYNMKAGVWMAPFICEKKSRVFSEHPEWIVKNEKGEPLYVSSNWSGFYPLDFDNPEVKEYIRDELLYMTETCKFEFLKLDFLYAVCIKHDGRSRAKVMKEAMDFIRDTVGHDVIILGCGVPLFSAFGTVDYCRIGPDVSLSFDDHWYMKYMHRERVSTKITVQNTINRYYINGIGFNNDPDVYILRKKNVKLSKGQKESLAIINFIFGHVYLTSDNVATYDEETKQQYAELIKFQEHQLQDVSYDHKFIYFTTSYKGELYDFTYDKNKGEIKCQKK